jgi:asparagine synthase (glutamine-hydrolysing)
MCGIVGIVDFGANAFVDEARLKRMRDVLRHRGPDGEGLWLEGGVGLGHRRLAIVDVAGGHQPMANAASSAWITYNGEIYNHPQLRAALETRGRRYRTRSDTETILHMYDEEGEACVERLHGMFAFGLWDRARRRLLLARDRLGIKPLYYAVNNQELVFASEIKAILAATQERPRLDEAILPEFLATRFVSGETTFFRGIKKLPPGHVLSWAPGETPRVRRYWALPGPDENPPSSLEAEAEELRARLTSSIRSHLMSDVPVGLFLSGGIDSSGLAALMAPMSPDPLRTFSVGFAEREGNELAYARLAAHAVGADHREIVVSPSEFFEALPRLVWHEDEPIAFPSSVPLHFVSRLAREHVKVVLTGEGADELFLGYNRYRVSAWNERLGTIYERFVPSDVRQRVRGPIGRLPGRAGRYARRSFVALDREPRTLFFDNFSLFPIALQRHLFRNRALLEARDPYAVGLRCYQEAPGGTLDRMSHADLQTYLVELLMKQDQMSMAASLESRVPFLDHELVEHVVALPATFKLRGTRSKAVLRAALRGRVPREILSRRKMGFPVPVSRWLRGQFWPLVEELVLGRDLFDPSALTRLAHAHRRGDANHGDRLWLLMNLELWQRIFLDGDDSMVGLRPTGR